MKTDAISGSQIEEESLPERPKLLWVDDEPHILELAKRAVREEPFDFVGTTDLDIARKMIRAGEPSVLVADQVLKKGTGIELLEYAKAVSPATSRIILTGKMTDELVEEAINRASVFRFITKPWDQEELLRDLDLAFLHRQNTVERYRLLQKIRQQNTRLEELNLNLEKIVYARTHKEELSKRNSEATLQNLRGTLRFINDLSLADSVEEILYRLSRDFRKFSSVGSPILGFLDAENRGVLYYLQGKQATEKRVTTQWKEALEPRSHSEEDRQYLANVLGRPLAQLLVFPLKSPQQTFVFGSAVLFIEHALPAEDLEELKHFLAQRIQPLSLALDRVLMENYLKLTSYRWAKTFDDFTDPIAIVDSQFSVDRSNRSFQKFMKKARCFERFADRDSPCPGCPLIQDFSSPSVLLRQIKVKDRSFQLTSYPIFLPGQTIPSNRVNYYSETTDKNRLQQQLIQNEKMSAVGLLAGNIAHELNNPLTGLRSLTQVLLTEVQAGTQLHGDLLEVEKGVQRCEEIIKSLLNFSQIGPSESMGETDLGELVESTLPFLKSATRDHSTKTLLGNKPLFVRVEYNIMQQVIFNLINNACQAMEEPGELTLSLTSESGLAHLKIKDTGPGIGEEHLQHVFDPFYTTKEEGQGTGLGLSMSRSAVESFGGTIEVETELGQGTTFIIKLPLVEK